MYRLRQRLSQDYCWFFSVQFQPPSTDIKSKNKVLCAVAISEGLGLLSLVLYSRFSLPQVVSPAKHFHQECIAVAAIVCLVIALAVSTRKAGGSGGWSPFVIRV
jgi:hypothetical protein